jgi:uncharacterized protein
LPGYNCGECGHKNCGDFADSLAFEADLTLCPFMSQERFLPKAEKIGKLLLEKGSSEKITGVIDGLEAEFALGPLPGEPACREDLHPFDMSFSFEKGDIVRYRPLGCPITHFGRVLAWEHGILTVHMVGPVHLISGTRPEYKDIGICMVAAFEGTVVRGRVPEVGKTVRFLPDHCMMQKVHSGVVVHSEGKMVRIEGIDLKVW